MADQGISECRVIPTDHQDIIHDVSFDYYGRRMATCSSDHTVKIWDQGDDKEWICTADWKRHSGGVWKVTWAHPEFGQVIATCSFDCTAIIWEEEVSDLNACTNMSRWVRRASLVDKSGSSVTDLKFSPHNLGLQLALSYRDGVVLLYEAPDVMNLSHWSLQHTIKTTLPSASCISWNPSLFHAPVFAVGSDDCETPDDAKVEIYGLLGIKWSRIGVLINAKECVRDVAFAPNVGRSEHFLAVAGKFVKLFALTPLRRTEKKKDGNDLSPDFSSLEPVATLTHCTRSPVWRVEWNLSGNVLSTAGADGMVRLWRKNYRGLWACITHFKQKDEDPTKTRNIDESKSV